MFLVIVLFFLGAETLKFDYDIVSERSERNFILSKYRLSFAEGKQFCEYHNGRTCTKTQTNGLAGERNLEEIWLVNDYDSELCEYSNEITKSCYDDDGKTFYVCCEKSKEVEVEFSRRKVKENSNSLTVVLAIAIPVACVALCCCLIIVVVTVTVIVCCIIKKKRNVSNESEELGEKPVVQQPTKTEGLSVLAKSDIIIKDEISMNDRSRLYEIEINGKPNIQFFCRIFKFDDGKEKDGKREIKNFLEKVFKIEHDRIVKYFGYFSEEKEFGVVFEKCSKSSIASKIDEMNVKRKNRYIKQILETLMYIQTVSIQNRFSENSFLISTKGNIKFDFFAHDLGYADMDIARTGLIIIKLLINRPIEMFQMNEEFWKDFPEMHVDILQSCLKENILERTNIIKLNDHFEKLGDDEIEVDDDEFEDDNPEIKLELLDEKQRKEYEKKKKKEEEKKKKEEEKKRKEEEKRMKKEKKEEEKRAKNKVVKLKYEKAKNLEKPIKVVFVGDGAVGKTSLLWVRAKGVFPDEYLPTVFDNYNAEQDHVVEGENVKVNLFLCDTAGQEDYAHLRQLVYDESDVFVLCYSVTDPVSFKNCFRWFEEIKDFCKNTKKVILAATKVDIRDEDVANKSEYVSKKKGEKSAKEWKVYKFIETSAKQRININEIFEYAIDSFLEV